MFFFAVCVLHFMFIDFVFICFSNDSKAWYNTLVVMDLYDNTT